MFWSAVLTGAALVAAHSMDVPGSLVLVLAAYFLFSFVLYRESQTNEKWSDFSRNVVLGGVVALVLSVIQVVLADRVEHQEFVRSLSQEQNLSGVDLRDQQLRGARLPYKPMHRADLRNADLRKANLFNAALSQADLTGADLRDADLREADLTSAILDGARLDGADLRSAILYHASLFNAELAEAQLEGAKLRYACLADATLREADFAGAEMEGAILTGADLSGAVFERDLRPALGISRAGLKDAENHEAATWPFDWEPTQAELDGDIPDDKPARIPSRRVERVRVHVENVEDGDTMRVTVMQGTAPETPRASRAAGASQPVRVQPRVRLFGIDAPDVRADALAQDGDGTQHAELEAGVAAKARSYLEQRTRGAVYLRPVEDADGKTEDKFGRTIAYAEDATGRSINRDLLERGLASVSVEADENGNYDSDEQALREAELLGRRGGENLWRSCPTPP